MRKLLSLVLLAIPTYAANRVVCNTASGETLHDGQVCAYTDVNTALAAAVNGVDTVILKAGQSFPKFTVANGKWGITIKSSRIDEWPRGYRITRNSGLLAKITTTAGGSDLNNTPIRIGEDRQFYTATAASANLVRESSTASTYSVGDEVRLGSFHYSPFWCASDEVSPWLSTSCPTGTGGKMVLRATNLGLAANDVLYVHSMVRAPGGLSYNTPYYVTNVTTVGSFVTFNLSLTQGGASIPALTDWLPVIGGDQPTTVTFSLAAVDSNGNHYLPYTKLWVKSVSSATITLARGPDVASESAIVWTIPTVAQTSGGTPTRGWSLTRTTAPYNITIDGLEVDCAGGTTGVDAAAGIYIYPQGRTLERDKSEPRGNLITRSWIHGTRDYDAYPDLGIYVGSSNTEISHNIIEHIIGRGPGDTQAINPANNSGSILIENNYLQAAGENIMSHGSSLFRYGRSMSGVTVRRNYLRKNASYHKGFKAIRVSDAELTGLGKAVGTMWELRSEAATYASGETCGDNAANTDFSFRCFWHNEADTRFEILPPVDAPLDVSDSAFEHTGMSGSGQGILYGLEDGTVHFRHNMATGTHTCATFVSSCSRDDTIAAGGPGGKWVLPDGAVLLAVVPFASGIVAATGTFNPPNTVIFIKNALESKGGDRWLIEGNVLENARATLGGGGGGQQCMLINMTVAPMVSDAGPADPTLSSSYNVIRYNLGRHAGEFLVINGSAFPGVGTVYEKNGAGSVDNFHVHDNLLYDIGSTKMTFGPPTAIVRFSREVENTIFEHNTAIDMATSFSSSRLSNVSRWGARYLNAWGNVFTPYKNSGTRMVYFSNQEFPWITGTGLNNWREGLRTAQYAFDGATSTLEQNVLMNRNSVTQSVGACAPYSALCEAGAYPDSNWLVMHTDANRDDMARLFTSFIEGDYAGSNYRINPARVGEYVNTRTGRMVGADIDKIESIIGHDGADVVAGIPEFSVRSNRIVSTTSSTAVISYIPNGSACTFKRWTAAKLPGSETDITESGSTVSEGRRVVTMSSLSSGTTYYVTRTCGAAVDVFDFRTL